MIPQHQQESHHISCLPSQLEATRLSRAMLPAQWDYFRGRVCEGIALPSASSTGFSADLSTRIQHLHRSSGNAFSFLELSAVELHVRFSTYTHRKVQAFRDALGITVSSESEATPLVLNISNLDRELLFCNRRASLCPEQCSWPSSCNRHSSIDTYTQSRWALLMPCSRPERDFSRK
jgi:hypothetical protein